MIIPLKDAVLFNRLKSLSQTNSQADIFAGKLLELEDILGGVLALIRRTFPHYTEHGRQHYLTLIQRMGQFLPTDLLGRLSGMEYFLLMAGAMLHDIGMVVAEDELRAVEDNKDFAEFRVRFLRAMPRQPELRDPQVQAVVDRKLVSEYFRATHHKRSAQLVLSGFGKFLAPFGPANSRIAQVLAHVCEGHGLDRAELENTDKFPVEIDIENESANIRFVAAVVRVADLLDMDSSRACPLILQLVSPLPTSSIEQWTRHELDDFVVSPREIRIGKRCTGPDEQWALYQWASWLDAEIRNTIAILAADPRTALVLPIPMVHVSSNGSYEFPEFKLPLPNKPRIRRIQRAKKECPSCRFVLSYSQKISKNSIKGFKCSNCGTRLYSVEIDGGLQLRKRDSVQERIVCPRCKKSITTAVDPVPGTAHLVSCTICNTRLRVVRGREMLRVFVDRPISPPGDQKFLDCVEELMGPQPWPKGQLRRTAQRLGATQRSVSKALQHLIRAGKFKFQVHGKLYAPEPENE